MRTNLLKGIIGIFLYAHAIAAYERQCDEVYGRPRYEDCIAAARRIPTTYTPIFFGPQHLGMLATISTPFVISNGNCEIRIQTSARVRTHWRVVQNVAAILVTGIPGTGGVMESGCVKALGLGGVATPRHPNDPMWIEVKEKGVPGPPEGGATAPLLKGFGPELTWVRADAPLPPGFHPSDPSSSTQGQVADIPEVDRNLETS